MPILVPSEPSHIAQAMHRPAWLVRMAQAVTALWPLPDDTRGIEQ